jgi:hypothetical protein
LFNISKIFIIEFNVLIIRPGAVAQGVKDIDKPLTVSQRSVGLFATPALLSIENGNQWHLPLFHGIDSTGNRDY